MKPITLHPLSLVAGLALAGVFVVLAGAAQAPGGVQSIPTRDVHGQIPTESWVHFELTTRWFGGALTQQDVYNVPVDRYLVLTAAIPTQAYYGVFVNGADVGFKNALSGLSDSETRLVFAPGEAISMGYPSDFATCNCGGLNTSSFWGYLEPVN